jgi:hypothetical protein
MSTGLRSSVEMRRGYWAGKTDRRHHDDPGTTAWLRHRGERNQAYCAIDMYFSCN